MRTNVVTTRLPASPLEVAPSKSNVCQALDTLYSTTSREERDTAQNWLLAFTQRPEAWGLSVELLGEDNITLAHFGGHTLQEKIKYHWQELPPEKQEELFRILLVVLMKYNPGPTPMLTRLSVVIAQVLPDQWPNIIVDFVSFSFQSKESILPMLSVFKILPEELHEAPIINSKRKSVEGVLRAFIPQFLSLMIEFLKSGGGLNDPRIRRECLMCLVSWDVPLQSLLESPLVELIFMCIEHFDDCVPPGCEYFITNLLQIREIKKQPTFLKNLFHRSVALHKQLLPRLKDLDVFALHSLARLYAAIGEKIPELIIKDQEYGPELAEIVIFYGTHSNPDIASQTFNFWYELASEFEKDDDLDEFKPHYIPVFINFLELLISKCVYPLEGDESGDFLTFRKDVADYILECYKFLGDKCLTQLYQALQQGLQQNVSPQKWAFIEAPLFAFKASSDLFSEKDEILFHVINEYPNFPYHPFLMNTAIKLLGECSTLLASRGDELMRAVHFILSALTSPELIASASESMDRIAEYCGEALAREITNIIAIVKPLVLDINLESDHRSHLMRALCRILSYVGWENSVLTVQDLLGPIFIRLQQLLIDNPRLLEGDGYNILMSELRLLSSVFLLVDNSDSEQPHPLFTSMQKLYPILDYLMDNFASDDLIIDLCTRILKNAVTNLNRTFSPFLQPLLSLIPRCYSKNQHPQIFSTYSVVVGVFSFLCAEKTENGTACTLLFGQCLSLLATKTISVLHDSAFLQPDAYKEFFNSLTQTLDRIPLAVATTESSASNFLFASLYIIPRLDHVHSFKAAIDFFEHFVGSANEGMVAAVNKHFSSILDFIFRGIANKPRSFITHYSRLLQVLQSNYPEQLRQMSIFLFNDDSYPSLNLTETDKKDFLLQICLHWKSFTQFRDVVHDFSAKCKGLLPAYAQATKPYL